MKLLVALILTAAALAQEPKPSPLTTEEKLAVRDLQVQILQLRIQQAEVAKQLDVEQVAIQKLIADLQAKHETKADLGMDLKWVEKPTAN